MITKSAASIGAQKAWTNRRTHQNIWTRTDSMRWMSEHSEEGVRWLQETEKTAKPPRSKQVGSWLMLNRTPIFNRAHERLKAMSDREGATLRGILKP